MDILCGVKPVLESSENEDVKPICLIDHEPKPQEPQTLRESQCPICFLRFPIQQIEEHVDYY